MNTPVFERPESDSLRVAVLIFLGGAIFWLLNGVALACLASWKLVIPWLLDGPSWLTYGRIQAAADSILVYGWASQAAIGVGLWFLAKLGRTEIAHTKLLITGAIFWNLAVTLGACGIIAGLGGAFAGLQFPGFAAMVLFIAYLCVAVWALQLLRDRKSDSLFVSQWFVLAAFLWFPWLYATGNLMLVWHPIQGSAQAPVAWWFEGGLFWLWLAPICIGAAYYLVPVLTGRPLHAYPTSLQAFWGLAFLGGWTGLRGLIGGPVPAWMVSASVAACIIALVPVIILGLNIFGAWNAGGSKGGPVLGFVIFGLISFAVAAGLNAATPILAPVTQFSDYTLGQNALFLWSFVSMVLFGATYYMLPRLIGLETCPTCSGWHFWLAVWGIGITVGAALLGGLIQGFALSDPGVSFASSVNLALPFRVLGAVGYLVILVASFSFAIVFVKALLLKARVIAPSKKRRAVAV